MSISIFLDIAIGVVFVWLMLAVGVMALQEWYAAAMKWRANDLKDAIKGMLTDDDLANEIYKHPLIQALSKPSKPGEDRRPPSYIPDRTFALALFDTIMTAGTEKSVIQEAINTWSKKLDDLPELEDEKLKEEAQKAVRAVEEALPGLVKVVERASDKPDLLISLKIQVEQLRAQFTKDYPFLGPVLDELPNYLTSQQIIRGVAKHPETAKALNSLMTGMAAFAGEGEASLAAFRTNVETWFNDTMDRLSGWYKRKAQWTGFVFGFVLAIVLNVDSIAVITTLWREPTTRAVLVAQAEALKEVPEVEGKPSEEMEKLNEQLEALNLPVGWTVLETEQCLSTIPNGNRALWVGKGKACIIPADVPEGIPAAWGDFAHRITAPRRRYTCGVGRLCGEQNRRVAYQRVGCCSGRSVLV
ncbi:MAG: hypothetical protein KAW49_13615 [Anaerolineae bacterium]|nr:hypothetical protein [Anaerolineae bacterium]